MPPQSLQKNEGTRRICPYCSAEVAGKYLWLHKKQYCPMRPGRQEQIKVDAMGIEKPLDNKDKDLDSKNNGHKEGNEGILSGNIKPVDLTKEYANMVKVMQQKKDEVEIGEEYQCAGCNESFYAKKQPKRCPHCNVEFE